MPENLMEDLQKTMSKIVSDRELSSHCQQFNQSITNTINRYKYEEAAWYDGRTPRENALSTTSQTLWYSHYLNKKRLDERHIGLHYENFAPTPFPRPENDQLPFFSYSHDGKNLICSVSDHLFYKKVWYRDGKVLWMEMPAGKEAEYYITQSRSVSGNIICPNCGYEADQSIMTDGCDYCKTKFRIEDFNQKISSFFIPKDKLVGRNKSNAAVVAIPVMWLALGGLMSTVTVTDGGSPTIPIMVTIGGFILLTTIVSIAYQRNGSVTTHKTKNKITEADPLFSEEYFLGNLMAKISSVHFADSAEEVSALMTCDASRAIESYRNVVECAMSGYVLNDYSCDSEYQHIDVTVELNLKCDTQSGLKDRREKVRLKLIKSAAAKTSLVNDAVVYTCKGCGSSVSLLNGGRCEFCKEKLDLSRYDWMISDYRIC